MDCDSSSEHTSTATCYHLLAAFSLPSLSTSPSTTTGTSSNYDNFSSQQELLAEGNYLNDFLYFCDSCCDDENSSTPVLLFHRALRFMKLIVLSVHRSYATHTTVLLALPLILGVTLGYFGARYWHPSNEQGKTKILTESSETIHSAAPFEEIVDSHREDIIRQDLRSTNDTARESNVPLRDLPKHVAIIMDGNRRYGKDKYGNTANGHWDGSARVLDCAKWCIAEQIPVLTLYAFSTENWKRDPREINTLMSIFARYCDELREEALQRNIRVHVWSTDSSRIPLYVRHGLDRLEQETKLNCSNPCLRMNICLSYGARGEIVQACQKLAKECAEGTRSWNQLSEEDFSESLLSSGCPDPDILIRTSGEMRISNYLLWQLAYTELFFLPKRWPDVNKADLIGVLRAYAAGRERRYGK